MPEALITPNVLRWARERAQFTADDAAQKVKVRPERLIAWEIGETHPTFRQAQKLAKAFHVPFGYFFLPSPPREELDIPDLRTVGGRVTPGFSLEFIDVYHDVLRKQEWFREYRLQEGARPLPFVGNYSISSNYKEVAADIRQELSIDDELRASVRNWEQFIGKIIEQAEGAGILVMRNSIVGNNTHRHLSVDEFRGLAISDPVAPLIFINSRDAKSAQIFTLVHELVHLWIGQSGVSNPMLDQKKNGDHNQKIETFCNRTAAEILVPEAGFLADWNENLSTQENIDQLSRLYRVSGLVIARRGYDLGRLTYDEFQEFYLDALHYDKRVKSKLADSDGGPGSYVMQKIRNGKLFSQAVSTAALEGTLSLRDGGALLGMKPGKLKKYADFLAGK
ncbi:MAG: XRE family transcriptional regulator [Thermodesulfobacteriota bacterium]|nr:XRE family transcriptional regulator [Thermodesulfobacteriota bacterium]